MTEATPIDYEEFEERTGFPAVASKAELSQRGARQFISADSIEHEGTAYRIEQMQFGDLRRGIVYLWKRMAPAKPRRTDDIPFRIHGEISPEGTRYRHYSIPELVGAIQPEKED